MREKQLRLLLTFHTTTAAMSMEKACKIRQLEGRLIPVPQSLRADCGLAWSADPKMRATLENVATECGITIEGYYEMMV